MYIKENKVIIRSAELRDISSLSNWWADGEIMAHAGFPNGLETDEIRLTDRINFQNKQSFPNAQLIIIELPNDYSIGEMNYREESIGVFEIGIKICVISERNNGYGAIAINSLIKYLKDDLKANKIILDTNLNNEDAQRFYKRLEFKQTKILKDCWNDQLGNLQSAVFFEKIL